MKIPYTCQEIINRFYENGYEAYVVGGCVRDFLMGKQPSDYDITTSASPSETKRIFEGIYRIISLGEKHGTITLIDNNKQEFEVTTYRIDGEYRDNRRPVSVEFTSCLIKDLVRRDFTINAMAYNNRVGFIDYFSGKDDISKKIIRCVGNPQKRLEEDALRIMRALRFKAQLGFQISDETKTAIKECAQNLENISVERIREELNKIILSNPLVIYDALELSVLENIIPQLKDTLKNKSHIKIEKIKKTLMILNSINKDLVLRLTYLFYNIELENTNPIEILKHFKYYNKTISRVKILLDNIDNIDLNTKNEVKLVLSSIGEKNLRDVITIKSFNNNTEIASNFDSDKIKGILSGIIDKNECYNIKNLNITKK
ncbi:MAG: hypothetical protein RR645_01115, partial [Clostridium sp.]